MGGESMSRAGASDQFRAQCAPIWDALHEHPFITELAEGSLPPEKFRFFLEQDDLYLEEYARCVAMGAARSRNDREQTAVFMERRDRSRHFGDERRTDRR